MKSEKTDRRIQYTKMVLRQSLLDLMKEKSIEKITVTDICKLADINRNTFYSHYASPQDLLAQMQDELFNKIKNSIDRFINEGISATILLRETCSMFVELGDLGKTLFSEYGDKNFFMRVMNLPYNSAIEEWYGKEIDINIDKRHLEWLYTFIVNGSSAVMKNWVQTGMKESPTDVATFLEKISTHNFVRDMSTDK